MPIGFLSSPSATAIAVEGEEGKLMYLRNLMAAQNTAATTTSSTVYHIGLDLKISFKNASATDAVSTFAIMNDSVVRMSTRQRKTFVRNTHGTTVNSRSG